MTWTTWILASAVFLALYDLAKKASVRNNAVLPVLLCSTSCGSLAFLVGLALSGHLLPVLQAATVQVILLGTIKSFIVAVSWIFTFCALRTLPLTIATPIRSSAPALVFLIAVLLYGEIPTAPQGLGMALVFFGYWIFSWAGRHEGIDFLHNRAIWCALAGMSCSALSAIFDKYVFQVIGAAVEPVQLSFQLGLVLVYAFFLLCTRLWCIRHHIAGYPFQWRATIPFVGILLAVADWFYFNGLAVPKTPISIASLMRRFSVVITFALSAIFFHETNLRRKGLALILILAGITLLCLK